MSQVEITQAASNRAYLVDVSGMDPLYRARARTWCLEQFDQDQIDLWVLAPSSQFGQMYIAFGFANRSDAVFFSLLWL